MDLAKAFDTVPHEAAQATLEFGGTPAEVIAWMLASWRAPRRCHVAGDLAEPLHPVAGIPAGDPLCPRVLGVLLEPWTRMISKMCPRISTWAYLDDRSLKAQPLDEDRLEDEALTDCAVRLTEEALTVTETCFDSQVGLTENKKKRQIWKDSGTCEHLGLTLQASTELQSPDAAKPRGGWAATEEVARRVALAPGIHCSREKIATICVLPRVRWAAALMEPPPWRLGKVLMKAILKTRHTPWCVARYWADRVQNSPSFSAAVHTLKAASRLIQISEVVWVSIRQHAARLGLHVVQISPAGVLVQAAEGADDRVQAIATQASRRQDLSWEVRQQGRGVFKADSPDGQHVCRVAARVACLQLAQCSRNDVEGIESVDVEVLSCRRWKRWQDSLSEGDRRALKHWRAGVVASPSRQQGYKGIGRSTSCPYCSKEMASARHLWAECPRFANNRRQFQQQLGMDAGWWSRQPRITSKSG